MANDIRCRNCGHTETTHWAGTEKMLGPEEFQSLKECVLEKGGYNPDPEEVKKLKQE